MEPLEQRLARAVVISEFVAENDSGLRDFAGEFHDWIELVNDGPTAVDVSGWQLTDDAAALTKWQIPATPATTALAPGGRLVVFASDKNGVFSGELHANFRLALAGGDVVLSGSDGATIVSSFLDYPQQTPDVAYGAGGDRGATVSEPLIAPQAPASVRPFLAPSAAVDDHWIEIAYDDSSWIATQTGVGFDRDGDQLDGRIFQELTTAQMNFNGTTGPIGAYVRVPFTVTNPEQLAALQLQLYYDDGYVLYLNGREVKRVNVNTTWHPGDTVEQNARGNRPDATVLAAPDVIDLTAWIPQLADGANVLAIYGANATGSTERNDFLIDPVLTAQRATGVLPASYLTKPTPNRPNGAGWLGLVGDTSFSVDRGFYASPQLVEITSTTADAVIRYTTDGTTPTATTGTIYVSPLTISETTTLRAAAFKPGWRPTDVDTQTCVFLDDVLTQSAAGLPTFTTWGNPPDWEIDPEIVAAVGATQLKSDLQALPTVSLVMNWQDLFGDGAQHGIYTETATWKNKSDERAASVEFFTAGGLEEFHANAAVEIQGHSSATRWNTDKLSFQVKFKAPYGVGELDAPDLFGNAVNQGERPADSLDGFILDAQYNYTWLHANVQQNGVAKYINDQVVADLQNLSGGQAPHGRWVHVYLNGLYWGIYDLHERPDDSFAQQYYGGAESDYFVVKAADGVAGHPAEYAWVDGGLTAEAAYAQLLGEADDALANLAEFQQVEALLDVDDFINYMIVHYYAGNYDWGQDNWYASINHEDPAGRWRFHAWDQEHAWPTADNQPLGENTYNQTYNSTTKNDASGPTGLHRLLTASPEYRLRFADRVQELMTVDGLLTPAAAASVFQARIDELNRAITGESARWGDDRVGSPYDRADWLANVNGVLTDFFPNRTTTVLGQFTAQGWLSTVAAPTLSQYGGDFVGALDVTLGNPTPGTIYYTLDGSDPRQVGGALAPAALPASGPIHLTDSTRLRARVLNGGVWSALVDETFLREQSHRLRIVELNYNPVGAAETTEFIEIANFGASPVSLDGVTIGGFATTVYVFQPGQTLAAGARLVVARNPTDFVAAYGAAVPLATGPGYADANLSNGGETISLGGPLGELLQEFAFADVAPWPAAADGGGSSLEYVGPLDGAEDPAAGAAGDPFDDPANWRASLVAGGTPGAAPTSAADADFNQDALVDGADLLLWQRGLGTPAATLADGDANGDAAVDGDDLAAWITQFGGAATPAATVASEALQSSAVAAAGEASSSAAVRVDWPAEALAQLTADAEVARDAAFADFSSSRARWRPRLRG